MPRKQEITAPAYRQIAINIAKNIAEGTYGKGHKLFGRSVLASQYRVSPETIRKAVFLLKDMGILETEKGSGIEVVSVEKAAEFIERHQESANISSLKNEVFNWVKTQAEQNEQMLAKIQHVLSAAERIHKISPLNPYQIKISGQCRMIDMAIGEVQFWHQTGGTIVAIRRGENLIVSPGPYATFCEGDVLHIVGDEASQTAVINLLFG